MKNKALLIPLGTSVVIGFVLIFLLNFLLHPTTHYPADTVEIRNVGAKISADGKIASQNEATLHFQLGGKLTYLPFKEGDKVTVGQTVASLDTYALQRSLSTSLNNYRSTRDTFDQAQQNNQTGVLQGQQKYGLEVTNKAGLNGQGEVNVINDMVARIVDQNQANLDNSVVQVELANYAIQLSSLTSPINGIITHEDVTVPNQNITPVTAFMISDPETMVFRALVSDNDIDYVSVGSSASIHLNGKKSQVFNGAVVAIHPNKIVSSTGQNVYQVDIQSSDLKDIAHFDQAGFAEIKSNTDENVRLVPVWTVLNGQFIWVDDNGSEMLKKVEVGKTHGDQIEIISGLSDNDKLIVNPEAVVSRNYKLL